MKKTLLSLAGISIMLCAFSCKDKNEFELNTNFNPPTELTSPASVTIDLQSPESVVLEWSGGGAADGSIVQYDVLFAAENGNFETPLQIMPSDLGLSKLTLSHVQLNTLARKAGIVSNSTGILKWTVRTSKAGAVKDAGISKNISVTRGEGLDNYPAELYLYGTGVANAADETEGRAFRRVEEGVFHIYTNLADGNVNFKSGDTNGEVYEYYGDYGVLREGSGDMPVAATANNEPVRITVDFNALSVRTEVIADLNFCWTEDGDGTCAFIDRPMTYAGAGIFKAEGVEMGSFFTGWTNVIGVYRFKLAIGDEERVWGSNVMDPNTTIGQHPTGETPVAYYQINEYPNPIPGANETEWAARYRMAEALQNKEFDVYIYTNKDSMFYHEFKNVADPTPLTHIPESLYLYGTGIADADGETEGRAFRKVAPGIFHIYTKLAAGNVQFKSSTTGGYEYYAKGAQLKEGGGSWAVAATAGNNPVRLVVNFNNVTVTRQVISDVAICWTQDNAGSIAYPEKAFAYQGDGNFKALNVKQDYFHTALPNVVGVYRIKLKIAGVESIWGSDILSPGSADPRPSSNSEINEYTAPVGEWAYWWKMDNAYEHKQVDVTISTNSSDKIVHEFSNVRDFDDVNVHTPTALYLFGSGSLGTDETEGRAFRQVSPGVFQIYTNLAAGDIKFGSDASVSSGYKYYLDGAELKEGDGVWNVAATTDNPVRLTVDFNTLTVTKEEISNLYIHYLDGNGGDPAYHSVDFVYQGEGDFKADVPLGTFNTQYPNTIACYRFLVMIGGTDHIWGSTIEDINTSIGQHPTYGTEPTTYYEIKEYSGDVNTNMWNYRWRFSTSYENKTFDITIHTNSGDMMYHEITNIH